MVVAFEVEENSVADGGNKNKFIKKKVDSRVRTLIENGIKTNHRSFFVVVGDHGKDQVLYLHHILSKSRVAARPSVLWCYKKELGFSSHRKKRIKQIQKMGKRGMKDRDTEDPFELFISGTNIRYCYYKESHKILGNTFGMCILQDFEALTPNLLARTIETVEGGGVVVLLLQSLKSLRQLYTMSMDVHSRYRTEYHNDVVGRFNERFILSLTDFENCLVVDDQLDVLPISLGKKVKVLPNSVEDGRPKTPKEMELIELKDSLKADDEDQQLFKIVNGCKTLDQAKAVLTFLEAITEKTLKTTVTLTAGRGRGKSSALGIAMAAAVMHGYSNIFVTSPTPENLRTLFEFMLKTFDALGYQEHLDYDIVQSTNPDFNKAIVRVNIYKNHRQTVQYIQPQDSHVLGQAELVVIDEAAAIPLPVVKKLLGPYLVFMASTINGYEGTGRSLSLKLIQQLRQQSRGMGSSLASVSESKDAGTTADQSAVATGGRTLKEIKLEDPIRYASNDPTEKWLNRLLCLDATISQTAQLSAGCPHPKDCKLFYVNRDTLFSYHKVSEAFLQRMMSLYVASHYKNTPNDLQLLSDAPAHHLFVLLPPVDENCTNLPEPLAVIQVSLEGQISRETLLSSLARGRKADGDLIPWTMSQQFLDDEFAGLSGARVVRIAVHPDYARMGYGSRALDLLVQYYEGSFSDVLTPGEEAEDARFNVKIVSENNFQSTASSIDAENLHSEKIQVRDASELPPLLLSLEEKRPPALHWVGVSYGLTMDLYKFWTRSKFSPVYMRQTANELTGEHTCIMLRTLDRASALYDPKWLRSFVADFKRRFLNLLAFQFRHFMPIMSLMIVETKVNKEPAFEPCPLTADELDRLFTPYDLKRLSSYANNMLDYHVITDLLPQLCKLYFTNRMSARGENEKQQVAAVELSNIQKAIMLGMALQYKSVEELAKELNVTVSQILALFARVMRKVSEYFTSIKSARIESTLTPPKVVALNKSEDGTAVTAGKDIYDDEAWDPTQQSLEEELDEASRKRMLELKKRQREVIDSFDMSQFEIKGNDIEWNAALQSSKLPSSGLLSVKNLNSKKQKKHKSAQSAEEIAKEELGKREQARKKLKKSGKK